MSEEDFLFEYETEAELDELEECDDQYTQLENRFYDAGDISQEKPWEAFALYEEIALLDVSESAVDKRSSLVFQAAKEAAIIAYREADMTKFNRMFHICLDKQPSITASEMRIALQRIIVEASGTGLKRDDLEILHQTFERALERVRGNSAIFLLIGVRVAELQLQLEHNEQFEALVDVMIAQATASNSAEKFMGIDGLLMDLLALELQYAEKHELLPKMQKSLQRINTLKTSMASSRSHGIINDCSGQIAMLRGEYMQAQKEFSTALSNYCHLGMHRKTVDLINKVVIASINAGNAVTPLETPEAKAYAEQTEGAALLRHIYDNESPAKMVEHLNSLVADSSDGDREFVELCSRWKDEIIRNTRRRYLEMALQTPRVSFDELRVSCGYSSDLELVVDASSIEHEAESQVPNFYIDCMERQIFTAVMSESDGLVQAKKTKDPFDSMATILRFQQLNLLESMDRRRVALLTWEH